MKTAVMLGAGQMGRALLDIINTDHISVLAIGDNEKKGSQNGIDILPVSDALAKKPDIVITSVAGKERSNELEAQARSCGYNGRILSVFELMELFDVRMATILRLAERIGGIEGAVAELGVYKGELARKLNALFPKRALYLFDTFEGFDSRDIATEREKGFSKADERDFSDTDVRAVMEKMEFPKTVVIRKGFFPATAEGIEERFAFVSIDADLYEPTLAGLEWFMPRMNTGGAVVLHDYGSDRFGGVKQAVCDYEKKHGRLMLVPVADMHKSAIVIAK